MIIKTKLQKIYNISDSYIEIMKLALVKNNITTVELFNTFGGTQLFDKIKNENSSNNILVYTKDILTI